MSKINSQTQKINFVNFSEIINWSVRYLKENSFSYDKKNRLFKVGDFLKRNVNIILIEDDKIYNRVTIKLYNKGVLKRDEEKGTNIGTKKQYVVKSGQFILSKIDARNGAFGIVPDELEGAITTADFLSYDIDTSKVNPQFLNLLTSTGEFLSYCQNASSGTTGRQRINESTFLNVSIPIPTIEEQNEIVQKLNTKIELAEKQEKEADQLEKSIKKYFVEELEIENREECERKKGLAFVDYKDLKRWDYSLDTNLKSKFEIRSIRECCVKISTGTTPQTNKPEYFDGDINFYTPADLTDVIYLEEAERKISQIAVKNKKARLFEKGTLLFVGIGSTIGKVAIINNQFASSNQQITGLKLNENVLNIEYAYYFFDYFKDITTKEKTQATIPIVNQDKILNIFIPCPSLEEQLNITGRINKTKDKIRKLQQEAIENRKSALEEFEKEIFHNEN